MKSSSNEMLGRMQWKHSKGKSEMLGRMQWNHLAKVNQKC